VPATVSELPSIARGVVRADALQVLAGRPPPRFFIGASGTVCLHEVHVFVVAGDVADPSLALVMAVVAETKKPPEGGLIGDRHVFAPATLRGPWRPRLPLALRPGLRLRGGLVGFTSLRKVCAQFVEVCRQMGLPTTTTVAIDGSKFRAVNNRDKNFTRAKVERRRAQLEASIARHSSQLDTADRHERRGASAKDDASE